MRRVVALTVLVLAAATAAAQAKAPVLQQLVVFKSGKAVAKKASSKGVLVKVGHHRCAAGTGTALALLARSKAGHLRLRDFGSCSRCSRLSARSSSPRIGWALGVPCLTRRTCSVAVLNSTWSQRRSTNSEARKPCR